MSVLEYIGLFAVVFLSSTMIDLAHARYLDAREAGRWHAAARWSVVQWAAVSVGFVLSVGVTLALLPAEGLGLYAGTLLGRKPRLAGQVVQVC